ncbi:M23 family metallopeptidase [Constantimarinum furrinae]|uniref:Metalloendopeptidase-like membrane protein n=1 Tax=Constantimarinum furrinae TaxID=2562285 RepID=A0A7G8PVW7_9FLAO|nr:M23 family metallopeptidase [Constantimarinum furrinae]QNJ98483.1 Metalloendopeptidase-like membrane protein [Constantimarinum furrinae]
MKILQLVIVLLFLSNSCSKNDNEMVQQGIDNEPVQGITVGCPNTTYPFWQISPYVLPYPVGKTYMTNLSHCSGSFHAEGQPDEYAIDFAMDIGTIITASRPGTVVHVVETGVDGEHPNNLVVIKHTDDSYAQYMHLTRYGAMVEIGDFVVQGDTIGRSGATGLAGYPHLHFVVTDGGWEYPYSSIPYTFKNTEPNPYSLKARHNYTAEPY